jgi:hypothetical protein
MATTVDFQRMIWENYPSKNTPINADNLNRIEEAMAGIYRDVETGVLYFQNVPVSARTGDIATVTNSSITADHVVIAYEWGNQTAISGNVSWTTTSGQLVLNGKCLEATTVSIILAKKMN